MTTGQSMENKSSFINENGQIDHQHLDLVNNMFCFQHPFSNFDVKIYITLSHRDKRESMFELSES